MDEQHTYPANAPFDSMHPLTDFAAHTSILKDASATEWSFSPLPWQFPSECYEDSPLSSLSSYELSPNNSWDPFEQSFEHSLEPMQEPIRCFPLPNQNDVFIYSPWRDPTSYISSIDEAEVSVSPPMAPEMTNASSEFYGDCKTPKPENFLLKGDLESQNPTTAASQPARDGSGRNHQPSNKTTTGIRHKRRKSSCTTSVTATNDHRRRSSSDISLSTNLTSVSSPPKKGKSTAARSNHNQVEKQYRNRLNGQFETLLETLPFDSETMPGKRVPKADVLVRAKRHIQDLEREKRELEAINGELEERVEHLRRMWVGMGGVVVP